MSLSESSDSSDSDEDNNVTMIGIIRLFPKRISQKPVFTGITPSNKYIYQKDLVLKVKDSEIHDYAKGGSNTPVQKSDEHRFDSFMEARLFISKQNSAK